MQFHVTLRQIAGGAALAAIGILITAYDAQNKMMPDLLFWAVRVVGVSVLAVGVIVRAATFAIPVRRFANKYRFQWPVRDITKPYPHQSLIDVSEAQRANIAASVFVIEQSVNLTFLEYNEPYMVITYWISNGSIYPVTWATTVQGEAHIMGRPLKEPLKFEAGAGDRWPPGHLGRLRLRQDVSKETANEIRTYVSEQDSSPKGGYQVVPMLQDVLRVYARVAVSVGDEMAGKPTQFPLTTAVRPELFVVTPNR